MKSSTSYKDFLDQVPWFHKTMSRDAIGDLLKRMGNFHQKLSVIHIAGTNGKGSVTKTLSSIYQHCGYTTATFTSPYILDYRECITINEKTISLDLMNRSSQAVEEIYQLMLGEGSPLPTHYECITVIALYAMYLSNIDLCIIEALMGGRDDATNVFDNPLATVITSISLDHTEHLGNTIRDITSHKAGIMKSGVPCFYGKLPQDAIDVISQESHRIGSFLIKCLKYIPENYSEEQLKDFDQANKLKGQHQKDNLSLSLSVLAYLKKKYPVSQEGIIKGLRSLIHPARLESINHDTGLWLLDGGHNAEGVQALVNHLTTTYARSTITLVLGMLEDKPYKDAILKLAPLCRQVILVPPQSPRAFAPEKVYKSLEPSIQEKAHPVSSIIEAFNLAIQSPADLYVTCGSFYTAIPMRHYLVNSMD